MAWRRGQALGQDLRERVLADAGRPARAVAARFGVSVSYVVEARARLRDAGEAPARPQPRSFRMQVTRASFLGRPRTVSCWKWFRMTVSDGKGPFFLVGTRPDSMPGARGASG